jgi:hypothetical protein
MFLSKSTVIHMWWLKDGERENKEVMVHPSDGYRWGYLDIFDPKFTHDTRNVCIGLATDGFTPFGENAISYTYWPVFAVPYNLPPSLYRSVNLCFFVSSYLVWTILDQN